MFTVEFTEDEVSSLLAVIAGFVVNNLEHYYDPEVVDLRSAGTKLVDLLLTEYTETLENLDA